jgi:hypothetical protein
MAYLPAPHAVHSAALYVLLNLPAAHTSHAWLPALRKVLGMHAGVGDAVGDAVGAAVGAGVGIATHPVAPPTPSVHVAAAQSKHSLFAAFDWYLPDGQW